MSNVLGRVTTGALDGPRGPDVIYRIRVAKEWLARGATVTVTLPRNIACARCEGGGCDTCGRSGAISLCEREELPPPLMLVLPAQSESPLAAETPTLVLRLPNQGGIGAEAEPRGVLFLHVFPAEESEPNVSLTDEAAADAMAAEEDESDAPPSYRARGLMILGITIVGWLSFYIMLRLAQLIK